MDQNIFLLYKNLREIKCTEVDEGILQSYLSSLYNVQSFKDIKLEVIEDLIKLIAKHYFDNRNVGDVTKILTILENLLHVPGVHLTCIDDELLWLHSLLKEFPELTVRILTVMNMIVPQKTFINGRHIVSNKVSKLLLHPEEILLALNNSKTHQVQARQLTAKIVDGTYDIDIHIGILAHQETPCELILYSLKVLREAIEDKVDKKEESLGNGEIRKIISMVWGYMTFDNTNRDKMSLDIYPSDISFPVQPTDVKTKSLERKRSVIHGLCENLMDNVNLPTPGDDTWENSRTVQSCIRHAAICLLITIVKCTDPQTSFQYWPYLIFPGSPSLRHCIRKDSSWCVRVVGLIALDELILSAKQFLTFAEKPRTAITSFTTFSETIGCTLLKLHDDFMMLLNNASGPIVKQSLRCLSTLVSCTPYQRISNTLPVQILQAIQNIITQKDNTITVECLKVINAIFQSSVAETVRFDSEIDWIFDMIFEFTTNPYPITLVVDNLTLLSVLGKNHLGLLLPKLEQVVTILSVTLDTSNPDVQVHAGKAIEVFSTSFEEFQKSESVECLSTNDHLNFWTKLLPSVLKLTQETSNFRLRVDGCDCLGTIDAKIFEMLERSVQIQVITSLFACTKDEEFNVRGAAIRAISRGVLEAGREEDPGLIEDIAQASMTLVQDSAVSVRMKAAWALSNLTDALLLNRERGDACIDDITDSMYYDLLNTAILANEDHIKVKCNVIRAIGNLVYLITAQHLSKDNFRNVILKAVNGLVKNASSIRNMKTKWNCCYAIGKVLKNENIYILIKDWDSLVYPALIKLLLECKNFKVRINAALALSSPQKRQYYSTYWLPIWTSVIQSLDVSSNMDDFREYKHRDTLVEQACVTLAHLISVANLEDLQSVNDIIALHTDMLKHYVDKCLEEALPEKTSAFSSAIFNLNKLNHSLMDCKTTRVINNFFKIFANNT